jgi:hypothetical protein
MQQAISDLRTVMCVLVMTALPCGCGGNGSMADAKRSDSEALQQPSAEDLSLAGLPRDAPVLFMTSLRSLRERGAPYLEVAIFWQDGSVLLGTGTGKDAGRPTMRLGSMDSIAVERLLSRLDEAGFFRLSPGGYIRPDGAVIVIGARFRGRRNAHCWDGLVNRSPLKSDPSPEFQKMWSEVTDAIRSSCPPTVKEAPASFRCYDSRVPIPQTEWLEFKSWAPLEVEKQSR